MWNPNFSSKSFFIKSKKYATNYTSKDIKRRYEICKRCGMIYGRHSISKRACPIEALPNERKTRYEVISDG